MGYALTEINIPEGQDLFNPTEIPCEVSGEIFHKHSLKALTETLSEVRALRDESFRNDPTSRAGFLAEQLLREIQCLDRGMAGA